MILNINWTLKDENKLSSLKNFVLNLVGIYLTIILILCVLLNSLLSLVFIRYKSANNDYDYIQSNWLNSISFCNT